MAALLPINPADFPSVPTRKVLLAIDLQNDFLAADGALPVKTGPDGFIARIISVAAAVRASGGMVVWVRSEFVAHRPADEQQLVTDMTPWSSIDSVPAAAGTMDAHEEAFLSVVDNEAPSGKPVCVRKGTKGAEFLPEIAAAKDPRDYVMTKDSYSAFESGRLLSLLRRQFATELILCGSLGNVSVYATALAASSHGFDITILEDCCGYRSVLRDMNASTRLFQHTGCEFIPTELFLPRLVPQSIPPLNAALDAQPQSRPPVPPPPLNITPELISAARAAIAAHKGRMAVRSRPSSPPLTFNPDSGVAKEEEEEEQEGEEEEEEEVVAVEGEALAEGVTANKKKRKKNKKKKKTATKKEEAEKTEPAPPSRSPSSSSENLRLVMEKFNMLQLNITVPEPAAAAAAASQSTSTTPAHGIIVTRAQKDDSPQTLEGIIAWDVPVAKVTSSSTSDVLVSMETLKLNTDVPEPAAAAAASQFVFTTPADGFIPKLAQKDDSPRTWEHVVAGDVPVQGSENTEVISSPSSSDQPLSMRKPKLNIDVPKPDVPEPDAAATTSQFIFTTPTDGLAREDDSPQTWEHVVAWDVPF